MEVSVRLAKTKDIRSICDLVNLMSPKAGDYRDAEERFERFIENNDYYNLYVATIPFANNEEDIVGTAMMHFQYKLSYNCGIAAHLEDVVVQQYIRQCGIGKALVNRAIEDAKKRGCYKIMLTCYEKTIPYYEKLGFSKHDFGMRMSLKKEF